jgi:hypothetical protein
VPTLMGTEPKPGTMFIGCSVDGPKMGLIFWFLLHLLFFGLDVLAPQGYSLGVVPDYTYGWPHDPKYRE